jgi:hypothetical protein
LQLLYLKKLSSLKAFLASSVKRKKREGELSPSGEKRKIGLRTRYLRDTSEGDGFLHDE